MRGAKSNALFLTRANCNRACPCVALVIEYRTLFVFVMVCAGVWALRSPILTEPSLFLHASGAWNSARSPLPTTFIRKNHRAVSTRAPYGESFADTTN